MLATQAPASTPARSRRASSSAPAASPSKPKRRTPRAGSRAATPVPTVKDFVEECKNLGKTRFIVIGDGAILECVNTFSQVCSGTFFISGGGTCARADGLAGWTLLDLSPSIWRHTVLFP